MAGQGIPGGIRILFGLSGLAFMVAAYLYITEPLVATKTVTERDAQGLVTKTTVEKNEQQADAIIIAAVGFGAILLLTALTDGRFKISGPGGSSVEVVAAKALAAAADTALDAKDLLNQLGEPPPPGPGTPEAAIQERQADLDARPDTERVAIGNALHTVRRWEDLREEIRRLG